MTTLQISLPIRGMTCASCTERIQASLNRTEGVINARVNFATEQARVLYDPARTDAAALVSAVRADGFDVPLERTVLPLRSVGSIAISREAWVDVHVDWHTRCVEIVWLGNVPGADRGRPSFGTTLDLLAHLFRSRTR